LEERTHGEVDRRGGGARVWPSDKKGLDKNESLLREKKTQRKERNKNIKKAKKKDGKRADGKKKESGRNGKKQ
jgi:hypothetical protein